MNVQKHVALFDIHYGYERKHGHKVPMHDPKALKIALDFTRDFKPDTLILGGDILDCGAISHHNKSKPGRTEGLRLLADAQECRKNVIEPLEDIKSIKKFVYIIGNHEDWLQDLVDEQPGLEGIVDLKALLGLDSRWTIVPQGEWYDHGKLTFVHGDQLSGGDHVAKAAVVNWERNIRFGHHHTFQVYTKNTPRDIKEGRTGVAVPCLCSKAPKYGEGKANRWVQGFNYGYTFRDGHFDDYCPIITNGRAVVEGKVYSA